MVRLLVLALIAACSQPAPSPQVAVPPPSAPAAPADAAAVAEVRADAAVPAPAKPAPVYRTDPDDFNVDPARAGQGKRFMVVSEDPHATKVGHDVLASGGNAVDAAVATALALAVTRPTAGNVGGGGFAVVRTANGKGTALDFREVAPAAATPDTFKTDPKGSLLGAKAVGVPGSVAGLWALHKKLGTKKWKDLVAPAIALAKEGYAVDPYLHSAITMRQRFAPGTGEFAARFMPGGSPLPVGAIVKNPELAVVLERIAAKGPDGFYKGPTAKALVDAMKTEGGLITAQDLARYKVVWREPLTFSYRGKHFMTMPLPSSGGFVLAMTANMLRAVDLAKLGWHSTAHVHWLAEIWRRAFAARNSALGDPAFVKDQPIARLTSQAEADRLVKTVTERATPSQNVPALLEGTNTTNFCVVDRRGMAVALTTTLNTSFGSGLMVSGILLNNEMDDFATRPGQPNVFGLVQGVANKVEPGKRPLSSMTPTIVEDEQGQLLMVVGAQGGPRIITAVWQVLSNVLDFGMPADAAVAAPRIHHQHLPDQIFVEEEAITKQVDAELTARGHETAWTGDTLGAANVIVRTPYGWAGAADPRRGGAAMGD